MTRCLGIVEVPEVFPRVTSIPIKAVLCWFVVKLQWRSTVAWCKREIANCHCFVGGEFSGVSFRKGGWAARSLFLFKRFLKKSNAFGMILVHYSFEILLETCILLLKPIYSN